MASLTEVKCVVVGDGAVGKTCMLISYVEGKFPEEYVPTVFENYEKEVECDGKHINFTLWDTAGQEGYQKIRTLSYKNADIFLVCFALNSAESFDNVKARWAKELKQHRASAPIILVGLKADLKEASFDSSAAEKLAEEIGGSGYMECSAKTSHGVSELFELALKTGLTAKLAGGKDNVKKGFFSRLMKK
jgi:Ras-related C3 botulinum toxin substrate 1